MRWPVALALAAVLAGAARASAQLSGGVDVVYAPSNVWRGLTRAESVTLQPAGWVRLGHDRARGVVTAGVWAAFETRSARPDDITLEGRGDRGFSEMDLWAQYTRRLPGVDVGAGVVRYAFLGHAEKGGRGPGDGVTEAYLEVWPDLGDAPFDPRAALYHEVEGGGTYLEVEATRSLSLLPLPARPVGLVLGVVGGFSLRASDRAGEPWERFAETGLTHVDASAVLTVPIARYTFFAAVHRQLGRDPATRLTPTGERGRYRGWGELGASITWGQERLEP